MTTYTTNQTDTARLRRPPQSAWTQLNTRSWISTTTSYDLDNQ